MLFLFHNFRHFILLTPPQSVLLTVGLLGGDLAIMIVREIDGFHVGGGGRNYYKYNVFDILYLDIGRYCINISMLGERHNMNNRV